MIPICVHETFVCGPRQIRSCGNSETFGSEIDFVPLKRAAPYLVGKKHVDKISVFVDSDFAGEPVSRESTTGLVAQIGNHTVKSGSTLQSLTALSVGEAEFLRSGGRMSSWIIPQIYEPRSGDPNENRNTKRQFDGEFFNGFDWEQDSERSTLTRGASGCKKESKTEKSVSRRCLQRKIVQMLERSHSLSQY